VRPIARLGYMDYTRVDLVFSMLRPGWPVSDETEAAD